MALRRSSCPQWTLFADKQMKKDAKPMKLYIVKLSAPCRAVWLYMLQQSIPHTVIEVDFNSPDQVEEFEGSVPFAQVPVLIDDDVFVFQGPAILRYLASNYTNYVGFGSSLKERMAVESLLNWADSELHRVVGYSYAYPAAFDRYKLDDDTANEVLMDHGLSELAKHLERFEKKYSTSKKFLVGNSHTVADSYLATVLVQAEWTELDLTLWPKVAEWLQRERQQPFWKQAHAAHNQLVKEVNYALQNE